MDVILANVENLSALGLFWDGVGVFILGVTSVFKARKEIAAEAGTYYDFNPHEAKNKVSSRMDVSIGSLFLLVGFAFQFLAAVSACIPFYVCIAFWISCPVLTVYYYARGKSYMVNRWVAEIQQMAAESNV